MRLREPRIGLLVLVTAATLSLTGTAQTPINPLVTRNPQPGTAPADCDQSLAPVPPPRVVIQEIPRPEVAPVEAPAPPTGSLRAALHATQTALATNDRAGFDESLSTARSLLATYPTGAERRSGEELVRVYEGAARLWDAQYQSPFFDQSSPEYAIVSAYPGYAEAVRRSTLTDPSGQRFYPAAESRDFLGRVAADRLRGIGIQAPTRVAERTPGVPSRPRATTQPVTPSVTQSTPRVTPRRTTTATTGTVRPPRPRRSAPAIASRPRSSTTSSSSSSAPEPRTSAPVTPTPSSPNPSAPPTTAAAPEPAAPVAEPTDPPSAPASPAAGENPAAPTTDTFATATETAVSTDTTLTAAPAAVPATTPGSRTRSVVLPTILILIGLVVLIVLFRASK